MAANIGRSKVPAGWSEQMTYAGDTVTWDKEYDDLFHPIGDKETRVAVHRLALVPPLPRFAKWQEVGTGTRIERAPTASEERWVEVEFPVFGWKLLSPEDSGKVVTDTNQLGTLIFSVNMNEYPETGMEGNRDIRVYLLSK